MKKLLSMLLVATIALTASVLLTGCGNKNDPAPSETPSAVPEAKNTVDAATWEATVGTVPEDFAYSRTDVVKDEHTGALTSVAYKYRFHGDLTYMSEQPSGVDAVTDYYFYEKNGEDYFQYTKKRDVSGEWVKVQLADSAYAQRIAAKSVLKTVFGGKYESFTFDAEQDLYIAENLTTENRTTYKSVEIAFKDGKPANVTLRLPDTYKNGHLISNFSVLSFTFENQAIALPSADKITG